MKTAMKIVSVLQLICGAQMLVLGIVTSGMFAAASAESLATLSVVLFVLAGLADILCGVFGLRAAGDGAKATPAIVLGVIALIGGVLNIVMAPSVHTVAACVIPVVYFVCALGLKKNAQ